MKKRILKLYENDVIRYIFWGGCTTLVNLVSFYIERAWHYSDGGECSIDHPGDPVCICCEFQICIS